MGCCRSCDEGKPCEDGVSPCLAVAPPISGGSRVGVPDEKVILLNETDAGGVLPIVEVARRLGLSNAQVTASEAVDMRSGNTATVGVVVIDLESPGTITVVLEQSNDLENWQSTVQTALQSAGYATIRARGIGSRFVRLRYTASGASGTVAILAALIKAWKR